VKAAVQIFLSYAREDEKKVGNLYQKLSAAGFKPWMDIKDILPGEQWKPCIQKAIRGSDFFLVCLSANSASKRGWVQREMKQALDLWQEKLDSDIYLIPIRLEDCEAPESLGDFQSVNLFEEDGWTRLVKAIKVGMERRADAVQPSVQEPTSLAKATHPAHLFICYKRHADPDQKLANYLHEFLTAQVHDVFIDATLRAGEVWLEEIDQQIKASDFLVVLLSKESADSEMVQAEVRRAYQYRKLQGHPHTLPVRMAYEGLLPYSIDVFLDPLQYVVWHSEADNERVAQDILAAIEGRLPKRAPIQARPVAEGFIVSEDGRIIDDDETLHSPLPEFDLRFLEELEAPGGAVRLRDRFYIERDADARLKKEVVKSGTTTTIRASRQTGKSSLLVRGVHHARQNGAKVVTLDLQRVDRDHLETTDVFLHYLAEFIVRKLRLDVAEVGKSWRGSLGPQDKLTYLMEDYVLPESDASIILAMDEVDRLLKTNFHNDFFALLRSWHNNRALDEQWNKLNIVMVISTEPYLLIADVTQSPFNVGLRLYLEDFDEAQVRDLNRRHNSPVKEGNFSQLMKLLSGHPYLTRKALYTLVTERWTWNELARVAPADHGPFGDHLRHHHWLLRDEPDLREALKQVIHHNRCTDEVAFFRLLRAGLVKGSGDVCKCRCDLYRMYFEGKL
jgi:hypothetical protein